MQTVTRPAGDIFKLDPHTVGWVLDLLTDLLDATEAEASLVVPEWKDEDSAKAGEFRGLASGMALFGMKVQSVERAVSLINVVRGLGLDPASMAGADLNEKVSFLVEFTPVDPKGTVEGDVIEAEFRAAEDALERSERPEPPAPEDAYPGAFPQDEVI